MTFRYGEVYFDNVEFYNMSQSPAYKSAIRWENNIMGRSEVTNCAFHNGVNWALQTKTSRNILLQGNVIWGFKANAIVIRQSNNITIDGNIVGKIESGDWSNEGAYSICSLEQSQC